jgi:uncharacterized OB-fold protein
MAPELGVPPQPLPDADTIGYWTATQAGVLCLGRCEGCRRWAHPPTERCSSCGAPLGFEPVAATGTLFSYVVVHQPCVPGYLESLPYLVGLIELDDQPGLRIVAQGRHRPGSPPCIGASVRLELTALPGGSYQVPAFRPL